MRGGGIKLQTTRNNPPTAHLLDLTRTARRAGLRPTGIDRIEHAYLREFLTCDTRLFGIVRTRIGYLLLDRSGCERLLNHCERAIWTEADLLSRMTRRAAPSIAVTESGLRRSALDRSTPIRLRHMLTKHMPQGAVYFNLGQTNYNDRMIHALRACDDLRTVVYLHDTIPLDWPDTQTQSSCLKFKRFFEKADHHADIVLCNSGQTADRIAAHATHLDKASIHVLSPGLPDMTLGIAPTGPWTDKPYFLAIGTIEPRKQIGFLLDLWDGFAGPNAPHLLICGRRGWLSEDVFTRLDQKPENVHELSDLPDDAMWALLKGSNGLLFPSIAEGFGYPAIEAAHLNVPLICNPLPVFREILGNYPIYAAESDRYVWTNKIEQLAQRRRGQSGEQSRAGGFTAPLWQDHFQRLFTLL